MFEPTDKPSMKRELIRLLRYALTGYVLLFGYIVMGYSLISGVLAIVLYVFAIRHWPLEDTESEMVYPAPWTAWVALAASAILLWKPYEVQPNDFTWRPQANLLSVNYYEPHAPRVTIMIEPDETTQTALIEVWASYAPWDWFLLDQDQVTRPQQRYETWKFKMKNEFHGEGIRWW